MKKIHLFCFTCLLCFSMTGCMSNELESSENSLSTLNPITPETTQSDV